MRVRTVSVTATLILVVSSVAACSSGSTATAAAGATRAAAAASSPGSGSSPSSSTGAGAGSSSAGGASNPIDVCALLTAGTVSQITGKTFTSTKSDSTAGVIFNCEYDGAGAHMLQVTVSPTNGKIAYDSDVSALTTVGHPPTKVSGVGDEAWSTPDPNGNAGSAGAASFGSYGALFGDSYIMIGGLTYVNADQGKQIVEQLHSKL
jgi:hypothetical protein